MIKVGITGGIGCGKSTVCRLFSEKGVGVYDSDREAKRLMHEDAALREAIQKRFGEEIYRDDVLESKALAAKVFGDEQALQDLNHLVHPAVMRDFKRWCTEQQGAYVLLESAILFDAGLEHEVDHTILVMAPEALRVERAAKRDGCDPELIRQRIAAQMPEEELATRADYRIVNILEDDLQGAVDYLNYMFNREANAAQTKQ